MASLSLLVSAQLSGDTGVYYPQSVSFGSLIDPNINPLRPQGEFVEIQELINTANYINTQVSDATASVIEMQMGLPTSAENIEGLTVPVAGRTDSHKIDLIEIAYYNQSILDTANANYYSAQHLLVDSYEENKDEMSAAIDMFTDAATEISRAEQIYQEAINAQSDEDRINLQNYIRANEVQIDQSTVQQFNQSLDIIEDKAQEATASLWASQDSATLAIINYDSISTLSNMTNASVDYDAWSDQLTVTWGEGVTDTVLQGVFFNNDGPIGWTQATTEIYDGFYGDTPPVTIDQMYSAYDYGRGETIASMGSGYNVNAKLYDPVQLVQDVIDVTNENPTTNYNNQNGNLGGL
tara:strand:- start:21434 stop:22489 length:1056 start_codon:yes stop_codon:yes gene_type:complete